MIRLKNVPKPKYLESSAVREQLDKMRTAIKAGEEPDFPPLWSKNDSVREALHKRHYDGKCAFTERRRDIKYERDVEHFRPKGKVEEEKTHKGYWWLAYEWDNLLISTMLINRENKRTFFPLLDCSTRVYNENENLMVEKPVLINPAIEDPAIYITFRWEKKKSGWMCGAIPTFEDEALGGRGEQTIKIIGINRKTLIGEEERAEKGQDLDRIVKATILVQGKLSEINAETAPEIVEKLQKMKKDWLKEIYSETKPERNFAGARRAFFEQYGLGDYIYKEENNDE